MSEFFAAASSELPSGVLGALAWTACAWAALVSSLLWLWWSLRSPSPGTYSCGGLAGGRRGVRAWEGTLASGGRVLLVGDGARGVSELLQLAGLGPRDLRGLQPCSVGEATRPYAIIALDGVLGRRSATEARDLLVTLCAQLARPGGVLRSRDQAALASGVLAGILRAVLVGLPCRALEATALLLCGRRGDARSVGLGEPHDVSAWLPTDTWLAARVPVGPLHELLVVRRLPSMPDEEVEGLRRRFGDTSMAFCTSRGANRIGVPADLARHFLARAAGSDEAIGYVAFMEHVVLGARLRLVLMDPVCSSEDRGAVVRAFLADCAATLARPIFSCVSSEFTALLLEHGFHTTMLGSEVGLPLATFRLPKERRRYVRAGVARGLECMRACYDLEELEALNATWVGSKACGTEVTIWTWPPSLPREEGEAATELALGPESEVRRLFTYQDGRLVGFVCAEPYYRGDGSGEILGYGLNTIRFLPRLNPPWISDLTVSTLIQELQAEGKATYLAFGLSPWCEMAPHAGDLPWLRKMFQLTWAANLEDIYGVQGLAQKKAHHCAGQGVRLHDRFIAGLPRYALVDTARFTLLLFGDVMIWKLPAVLASVGATALGSVRPRLVRTLRRLGLY